MHHSRHIHDDQLYIHFVTFGVDGRRRMLNCDQSRRILLDVLNEELEKRTAKCLGYVVMPDHVHVLVWFPIRGELSRFMQEWKRRSSILLRKWFAEERQGYAASMSNAGRFWQPKYFAFEIYSDYILEQKLDYIHLNPVRAGLVSRAVDWKWSSARWYELRQPVGVPIQVVD